MWIRPQNWVEVERRQVLKVLARADFVGRYKQTSFGLAWAVVLPVIQALVITVIFSRLVRLPNARDFGAYVLAGMICWSYFSQSVSTASTSIVDGAALTDKVWFPRAILTVVPLLANLPGLLVSAAVLIVALPFLGSSIGLRIGLLPLGILLLVTFSWALSMLMAALHVYFRDVRYLLQAALLLWFYVTPLIYPRELLGKVGGLVDLNPMTGIVTLVRLATVGATDWQRPVAVSVFVTIVLLGIGIEAQRRRDRLFVDLL